MLRRPENPYIPGGVLPMNCNKITVVGAGHVGEIAAQRVAEKELAREVDK